MNINVVYATKTKHSKKLAQAIASEFGVKAQNINDKPEIKKTDILFIVGGIYGGQSLPQMIDFVKNLDNTKVGNVALFTSCCSKKAGQTDVRNELTSLNIEVIDEFICQGSFLFFGLGHPNNVDIENGIMFAKKIVNA